MNIFKENRWTQMFMKEKGTMETLWDFKAYVSMHSFYLLSCSSFQSYDIDEVAHFGVDQLVAWLAFCRHDHTDVDELDLWVTFFVSDILV